MQVALYKPATFVLPYLTVVFQEGNSGYVRYRIDPESILKNSVHRKISSRLALDR